MTEKRGREELVPSPGIVPRLRGADNELAKWQRPDGFRAGRRSVSAHAQPAETS